MTTQYWRQLESDAVPRTMIIRVSIKVPRAFARRTIYYFSRYRTVPPRTVLSSADAIPVISDPTTNPARCHWLHAVPAADNGAGNPESHRRQLCGRPLSDSVRIDVTRRTFTVIRGFFWRVRIIFIKLTALRG